MSYTLNRFYSVLACDEKGGISKENKMPWHIREDLLFFQQLTRGHIVIMGRFTYEDIPEQYRPLPERVNIIVTSSEAEIHPNIIKACTIKDALAKAHDINKTRKENNEAEKKVFVAGGVRIFNDSHNLFSYLCDGIYVTHIQGDFECTKFIDLTFINRCTQQELLPLTKNETNELHHRTLYKFNSKYQKAQEEPYLKLLRKIYNKGAKRGDRTGVGTISIFGATMKFDISQSIPIFTTKKVLYDKVIGELLWFVSGSTDVEDLQKKNIRFWDANSSRDFLDKRGLKHYREGDLGPVYGFQWRHWGANYENCDEDYTNKGIDQLANVISTLKNDPNSRRIIISAWNVGMIDQMALPPCHILCQFYVRDEEYLDCQLYQRSGDMFLGVPFNVTSYSVLTYMIAKLTNLKPGKFIHVLGDAHIYLNHLDAVEAQLARTPLPFPTLKLKRDHYDHIDQFTDEDFILENYHFWPFIRAEMAV